ncbi:hypothetical protein V1525DRAFT_433431 [Lipomyces kononenkoae]|uniref:Uncharacterized protein n=1 Tax=Lipomyces kononenkoae TaxID=34357 RepID=A0ACC3SZ92_LIPKO
MSRDDYCRLLHDVLIDARIKEIEILKSVPPEMEGMIRENKDRGGVYDKRYYPLFVVPNEHIVGIPKPLLMLAFRDARTKFYDLIKLPTWTDEQALEVSQTSLVLLLVGSENLTAINARKRLLSQNSTTASLSQEFRITTVILCSRLQKHSKSPLIWNYHKQLVSGQLNQFTKTATYRERTKYIEDLSKSELQTVLVAAEHHPMNYYAWAFARWVFADVYGSLLSSPSAKYYSVVFVRKYYESVVRKIEKWCFSHPSDTSAWSFFQWVLFKYVDCAHRDIADRIDDKLLLNKVNEVILFATTISLARESVWSFVRRVVADVDYISDSQRDGFVRAINLYLRSRSADAYGTQVNDEDMSNKEKAKLKEHERILDNLRDKDVYVVRSCLNWIAMRTHLKKAAV